MRVWSKAPRLFIDINSENRGKEVLVDALGIIPIVAGSGMAGIKTGPICVFLPAGMRSVLVYCVVVVAV